MCSLRARKAHGLLPLNLSLNGEFLYGAVGDSMFNSLGYVMLGVISFFFVFVVAGISFVRERTTQTMERLMTTPVRRCEVVVLGYTLGFGFFAVLQSVMLLLYAFWVLGLTIAGSVWVAALTMILLAMSAVRIGAFFSIFSENEFQVMQFIPVVVIPQIFFSGLISLDALPYHLGAVARVLPVYYACDALKTITVRGGSLGKGAARPSGAPGLRRYLLYVQHPRAQKVQEDMMMTDESRRERIIAYAAGRFMKTGPSGVTMEEIARGVAMGKGTVYRLFPSKEALAGAVVDFVAAQVEAELALVLHSAEPPEARLAGLVRVVAERLREMEAAAAEDIARTMPVVFEKIEHARRRIIAGNLTELLAEGKAGGSFREDLDERLATQVLIGALAHLTSPGVLGPLGYPPEQLFRALVAQLMEGWKRR